MVRTIGFSNFVVHQMIKAIRKIQHWTTVWIATSLFLSNPVWAQPNKVDSLEQVLKIMMPDSMRIVTLIELGTQYNSMDVPKAFEYLKQAYALAQNTDIDVLMAKVDFAYGNCHLYLADYRNALFYYQQALKRYDKLDKQENVLRCLNNIGAVYSYLGRLDLAEQYFLDALRLSEKNNYHSSSGLLYNSLAYIFEQKKNYSESIRYSKMALRLANQRKDTALRAIVLENLGSTYLTINKVELAKECLNEALVLHQQTHNLMHICTTYDYLSRVAIQEHDYTKSENLLILAGHYARKAGLIQSTMENHLHLADLYTRQNKFKKAYTERLLYQSIKDSLLNIETYQQVNELQNAFILERKNNEIKILNKDKELFETNNQREKLLRNIFVALSVSVCLIALILLRNIKLKQRLNRSLERQNERLKEENIIAKYEVLKNRIDPHFLFNSLSTLSSIVQEDKGKATEFIEHFATLYRQVLQSGDVSVSTLRNELLFIRNYIYLQQVRFGNKLQVQVTITDTDEDTWYIPSFAIQLAVENAIKHNIVSSSNPLLIELYIDNNTLFIRNTLQRKTEQVSSTGMGLSNILERYRLLNSDLPLFYETQTHYIASLPLLTEQHHYDSMHHH